MEERVFCHWCQLAIGNPAQNATLKDKLTLHNKPILCQRKSCVELYETYCKYVKEKCE